MIKIFSVQEKKAKEDAAQAAGNKIKLTPDMGELNLDTTTAINFPNGKEKIMNFEITIKPLEGMYRNGAFTFTFAVAPSYPHTPPKVKCTTKVYHPNIDLDGNVCLNILREDWKPVLTINHIIIGLQFLMADPNPDDPLNKEAAEQLVKNKQRFQELVQRAIIHGTTIGADHFPACRAK